MRERVELNALEVENALFYLDVAAKCRQHEHALRLLLQARKTLERVLFDLQQLILNYHCDAADDDN